jgi:hypothetical protein
MRLRHTGVGRAGRRCHRAGHESSVVDNGSCAALRPEAAGAFLVVPRPPPWWPRLSSEVTNTLMAPVAVPSAPSLLEKRRYPLVGDANRDRASALIMARSC